MVLPLTFSELRLLFTNKLKEKEMSLSNMKVFNVKPDKKQRVKRLSNGNFVSESYCTMGEGVVERCIDYIFFSEASEGSIELK